MYCLSKKSYKCKVKKHKDYGWHVERLAIQDFTPVVPWKQIEGLMSKKMYKHFEKWMVGQTCMEGGVYPHDLNSYLEAISRGQKNPIVWD